MSKIGDKPIAIKQGVTVSKDGEVLLVKGPLGELQVNLPKGLEVEIKENEIKVKRVADDKIARSNHGTIARLISNAIEGTTTNFSKTLEIVGTGYKGQMEGNTLVLSLGYSHQIKYAPPENIKVEALEGNKIKVSGADKMMVGLVADKIKRFKKPDSYKGKGIRYLGEKLRLKPGKAAAKATGPGAK